MNTKRGQLKISFGMIFSIFLIIVFLAFAVYAITKFLDFQKQVTITKFHEHLSNNVKEVWGASEASKEVNYILPTNVERVCFKDDSYKSENVILYGGHYSVDYVNYINAPESVCIDVVDGKVNFLLVKHFNDSLVSIEKNG